MMDAPWLSVGMFYCQLDSADTCGYRTSTRSLLLQYSGQTASDVRDRLLLKSNTPRMTAAPRDPSAADARDSESLVPHESNMQQPLQLRPRHNRHPVPAWFRQQARWRTLVDYLRQPGTSNSKICDVGGRWAAGRALAVLADFRMFKLVQLTGRPRQPRKCRIAAATPQVGGS